MRVNRILWLPAAALLFVLSAARAQAPAAAAPGQPDPSLADAIRLSQAPAEPGQPLSDPAQLRSTYLLGPDDQITVSVLNAEEISDKPIRIDMSGNIRLHMAGRIHAAGLTIEQLEAGIVSRMKEFIQEPQVSVSISEFRSQPVSVVGSVKTPGVHQLEGRKTLIEILSLAGGLSEDAGHSVKITRRLEWGAIPLANAQTDPTGKYSVAEVSLKEILEAKHPEQNIVIKPNDVVTIPRAEMIYVTGKVQRSGGFILRERETLSVLQALALAGGLDTAASPKNARILRRADSENRAEIAVNLKQIMLGKEKDVPMRADDILFVPENGPKRALTRAAEAAIQLGTGVAIYRR